MNLEITRVQLQATIQDWIDDLMKTNNIPASLIEDALNKSLIKIKDLAFKEYLLAIQKEALREEQEGKDGRNNDNNSDTVEDEKY